MKTDLINLYLFGQSLDHPARLQIAKVIKEHNKNCTFASDMLSIADIVEYMYPTFYANLSSQYPHIEFTTNFSVLICATGYRVDPTHDFKYFGSLRIFEYYLTKPSINFQSLNGIEFILTQVNGWHTFTPFLHLTAKLTYQSIRSNDYNYIEKR